MAIRSTRVITSAIARWNRPRARVAARHRIRDLTVEHPPIERILASVYAAGEGEAE